MIVDLHTHSDASDGCLAPQALLALAAQNRVDVVSITDHDTTAAYPRLGGDPPSGMQLVAGIELSTTWAGRGIHVVGLNIDPVNPVLQRDIARQQAARRARAETIAARLAKLGVADAMAGARRSADGAGIGRPHFARHLVEIGFVKDTASAFRKYLGAGKPGDVRANWAPLADVVRSIESAGGTAVLAHPAKYGLTTTKLRLLLEEFVAVGGRAIEVVCGSQTPAVTRRIADLARDFGLAASSGSDFHGPETAWSSPGRTAALPRDIEKVWELW